MNWFFIAGVLLLYLLWLGVAGISALFPVPVWWAPRLTLAWAVRLAVLQTAPSGRLARRSAHPRPLGDAAFRALVAFPLVGAIAIILAPWLEGAFPVAPPPGQGGTGLDFSTAVTWMGFAPDYLDSRCTSSSTRVFPWCGR